VLRLATLCLSLVLLAAPVLGQSDAERLAAFCAEVPQSALCNDAEAVVK